MDFTRVIPDSDLSYPRYPQHFVVIKDTTIITDPRTLPLRFIRTLEISVAVIVPGLLVDGGHPLPKQELPEFRDLGHLLELLQVIAHHVGVREPV